MEGKMVYIQGSWEDSHTRYSKGLPETVGGTLKIQDAKGPAITGWKKEYRHMWPIPLSRCSLRDLAHPQSKVRWGLLSPAFPSTPGIPYAEVRLQAAVMDRSPEVVPAHLWVGQPFGSVQPVDVATGVGLLQPVNMRGCAFPVRGSEMLDCGFIAGDLDENLESWAQC